MPVSKDEEWWQEERFCFEITSPNGGLILKKTIAIAIDIHPNSLVIGGPFSHWDLSPFKNKQYDDADRGSFLRIFCYYKKLAIDATNDDGSLGQLINHTSQKPNVIMNVF